jgi:hypothetical protein
MTVKSEYKYEYVYQYHASDIDTPDNVSNRVVEIIFSYDSRSVYNAQLLTKIMYRVIDVITYYQYQIKYESCQLSFEEIQPLKDSFEEIRVIKKSGKIFDYYMHEDIPEYQIMHEDIPEYQTIHDLIKLISISSNSEIVNDVAYGLFYSLFIRKRLERNQDGDWFEEYFPDAWNAFHKYYVKELEDKVEPIMEK